MREGGGEERREGEGGRGDSDPVYRLWSPRWGGCQLIEQAITRLFDI